MNLHRREHEMSLPLIITRISRFRILLCACLLFVSGGLILGRWKTPPAGQPQIASEGKPEAEIITVTPAGFEPTEITRPRGPFVLAVDNRSGLDALALYLELENGSRVNTQLTRRGKLAWRELVDFPPGTYLLRAANDETWSCRITLTAR